MNSEPRGFEPALAFSDVQQRVAGRRLGRHDQRDVERDALGVDVLDDVGDRQAAGLLDALDQIAAQPARDRRREGRDDDLVGMVLGDGVHRGGVGIGVADVADRVDALVAQEAAGQVDAHLRRVEDEVVVDDVAVLGLVARHADDDAGALAAGARALLDDLQQQSARERLVGHDQDGAHVVLPFITRWVAGRACPPGSPWPRPAPPGRRSRGPRPARRTRTGRRRPSGSGRS